ncbi:MAG TPA: hypothetical protein VN892_05545 [Solirubrobacteraceae bacterium]|nr:hypothetical protein [Solirubrobacteraceae bacterium]
MKRLETYCDASVSAEGKASGAWASYTEFECAPRLTGSEYLGAEVEVREAECMAVIAGMSADVTFIEAEDCPDEASLSRR